MKISLVSCGFQARLRGLRGMICGVVAGVILLAWAPSAHAANNCPWMNEATASDLLGASATASLLGGVDKPSGCVFTGSNSAGGQKLTILVEGAGDAHERYLTRIKDVCPRKATVAISAIGNEAAGCAIEAHRLTMGQRAVGRVRDQIFTLMLETMVKGDSVFTPEMLQMKMEMAAEQVAGNLF